VAAAAPAYTMAGRLANSLAAVLQGAAEVPGVGQYDAHLVEVHLGPTAPAYSMAGRLVEMQKEADGPSCVDYDAAAALARCERASPTQLA
jgi:hypothetical protein